MPVTGKLGSRWPLGKDLTGLSFWFHRVSRRLGTCASTRGHSESWKWVSEMRFYFKTTLFHVYKVRMGRHLLTEGLLPQLRRTRRPGGGKAAGLGNLSVDTKRQEEFLGDSEVFCPDPPPQALSGRRRFQVTCTRVFWKRLPGTQTKGCDSRRHGPHIPGLSSTRDPPDLRQAPVSLTCGKCCSAGSKWSL